MSGEPVDPDDEAERAKAAERLLGGRDMCRAVRCRRRAGTMLFCKEHWRSVPEKIRIRLVRDPDNEALLAEAVAELRRIELERADR